MRFETSVQRPVEAVGVGLHSGVPVRIRILPAPPSTGIVFVRTDLDGFMIPASWRHVQKVSYATSLMRQGVLMSTTEHLLSTFYSMSVDNAYVEIDNLEVPDSRRQRTPVRGSDPRGGHQAIRANCAVISASAGLCRSNCGDKKISILPSDRFLLTCDVFFPHPLVGRQVLDIEVTPERYAAEIAPARTFGFEYELDQMRNMGLIRGASLENAVCFDRNSVLNPGGLRFATNAAGIRLSI